MNIKIKKASGIIEDFNSQKLLESLIRSGADREHAEEVIERMVPEITPYTSTKRIFRLAHKYLRQFNHASVLRYSLKRALFRLGPSGYPFEKFFAELLRHYGYHADVNVIMEGQCVKHEIDVFAESEKEILLVECKYRNTAEGAPDVKTTLYVNSRFQDLKPVIKSRYPNKAFAGWLVTNTRFTSDALQYSRCIGLKVKSWRYPDNNSLEKMIEDKKLYPVTVMSTLNSAQIRRLIEHRVILMKDLAQMKAQDIQKLLSVKESKASILKQQADELCFCGD
ncbi:MAG: restriction endonuclease [Nitrospirae bacterium]|nr:restriction endonuclease [Nitrospirota bacterium]